MTLRTESGLCLFACRNLIKTVKGVAGNKKNRIMYMLYEIEPSAELSGGPWYTATGDFNTELIDNLKEKAFEFVLEKQTSDLNTIVSHIQLVSSMISTLEWLTAVFA